MLYNAKIQLKDGELKRLKASIDDSSSSAEIQTLKKYVSQYFFSSNPHSKNLSFQKSEPSLRSNGQSVDPWFPLDFRV